MVAPRDFNFKQLEWGRDLYKWSKLHNCIDVTSPILKHLLETQRMLKSDKPVIQNDNDSVNKTKGTVVNGLGEKEEQGKDTTGEVLNDNQLKQVHLPANAGGAEGGNNSPLGNEKNSLAANVDFSDTKNVPALSGDGKDGNLSGNAMTNSLNNLVSNNIERFFRRSKQKEESVKKKEQAVSGDVSLIPLEEDGTPRNTPPNDTNMDTQSVKSADSTKWSKKQILSLVFSLFAGTPPQDNPKSNPNSSDEDSDFTTPNIQLIEMPKIPSRFRAREINGFGILSNSQSLPMETKKQYQNLLNSGVTCVLQFCKYLEITSERSKKQDIRKSFIVQFSRMHSELAFTVANLNGTEKVNTELLLLLKTLFNDLFSCNHIIWIANKFEYDDFGRKFRKTIAEVLREEFQYEVSHNRDDFYRHVIAASLLQWKRNIPFPK